MHLFLVLLICFAGVQGGKLVEKFAWKQLQYSWPDQASMNEAIQNGSYIPENNLPLGLARWKNKLFVTVPRWKAGVASSLNYVMVNGDKSQPLIPYPSWSAALMGPDEKELSSNETVVSVFRVWVDTCDRLWVMDTGFADIFGKGIIVAQPSILIFDLNTDKLIQRYFFKPEDSEENTFFANIVVDVDPEKCDDAFAYVPDLGSYGTVVYSLKSDKSWRVKHHYFHFDPLAGQYNVGGVPFQWTDGIFSFALAPVEPNGYRKLFFHALSSTKEFVVSSEVFKNETWATSREKFHDFSLLGDKGPLTQTSASYFDDKTGVLFYTQVNRDGVGCWNSKKPFNPENQGLVDSNPMTMEFPNDLKVDEEGNLWVLSDRMPRFLFEDLDSNDTNYRIFSTPTTTLVQDTVCA